MFCLQHCTLEQPRKLQSQTPLNFQCGVFKTEKSKTIPVAVIPCPRMYIFLKIFFISQFLHRSTFLNQICTKSLIKRQPYMHFFPSRLALTCLRNSSSLPLTWHLSWVLRAMRSVGQSWLLAHKEAAVNLSSAMAHKKSAAGMQNCASSEKNGCS